MCGSVSVSQIKADSFLSAPDDDVLARLDNFRLEMLKYPGSTGHIVVHKARRTPMGEFLRYFYGIQGIWKMRGYPANELVLHPGKETEVLDHESWIVAKGEQILPEEFSIDTRLKEQVKTKRLFDSQCIGCDPAVPLRQWMFNEGLTYFGKAIEANPESRAQIVIGKNAFVSSTRAERHELRQTIYRVLTGVHGIKRNRIDIHFTNSMFARLYIVPAPQKRMPSDVRKKATRSTPL